MLHPMGINRADIVSRAADIIRRAGMDQSIWRKSPEEFRVLENRVNSMGFEDPIIVAEARNIIRVIYSAILRRSIAGTPYITHSSANHHGRLDMAPMSAILVGVI